MVWNSIKLDFKARGFIVFIYVSIWLKIRNATNDWFIFLINQNDINLSLNWLFLTFG